MKKQKQNHSGNQTNSVVHHSRNNAPITFTANELFQSGKMRSASGLLIKEVLIHPENIQAQTLLDQVNFRRNGMMFYQEFQHQLSPSHRPSISLCLIAKNEEKSISQCLDSYKDFVDEIIVVDTGSTDRTVEIARSHGAEIRYFPWINDFAAARNISIQNAKGDWILRTDADEWAEPAELIKLQNAAVSGVADLYFCKTVSANLFQGDPNAYGVQNLRLFKNHLGLNFERAIHETITSNLADHKELKTAITNIVFLHSGYDVSEQDMETKISRNLKICETGLEKDPNDRFLRMVHGVLLFRKDQDQGAIEMEAACTGLPQNIFPSKYLELCYIFLIQHFTRCRNKEKISKFIDEALVDYCSDALMLQYLGEKILFALGDIGYAIKVLNRALICNPSEMVSDVLDPKYYTREQVKRSLMEAYLLLEEMKTAGKLAREIIKNSMISGEGSIDKNAESGKENSKADILNNLVLDIALKRASENSWIELARLELHLGRSELAIVCASHAIEMNPGNQEAFDLMGIAAIQNKDNGLAQESFVSALIINPAARNTRNNLDNFSTLQGMTSAQVLFDQGVKWYSQNLIQKAVCTFMIASRIDLQNSEAQKYIDLCVSKL